MPIEKKGTKNAQWLNVHSAIFVVAGDIGVEPI